MVDVVLGVVRVSVSAIGVQTCEVFLLLHFLDGADVVEGAHCGC
jgi:hypothetical protein